MARKSSPKAKTSGRPSRANASSARPSSESRPYAAVANQYARDIVAEKIPANQWIRRVCKRHLEDLGRERDRSFPYRFDIKLVAKACRFIELLPHVKGKWARPKVGETNRIRLEAWQVFATALVIGWVQKGTNLRRFRRFYLKVARKNAKSTWAAAIGLFLFCADGEYGAEVYSGATTEKQAWEVFRPARLMAVKTPQLHQYFGVEVNAKSLIVEDDFSRFEPVVGKPGDGASPSAAITDEFHEHVTPELLDTMETGMGAREQPLSLIITTAGSLIEGPCYTLEQEAKKVLQGLLENDHFLPIMYGIDEEPYEWNGHAVPVDDWTSDLALVKANPNIGVSVYAEFLRAAQREAIQSAHKQNTFKTKHLNVWVNARSAWMNMEAWRKAADKSLRLEDFMRHPCYEGEDLAAKIDLASRCKIFVRDEGGATHYYVFSQNYVPQDRAMDGEHQHYERWVHDKWLTAHPGPEIQLPLIQRDIEQDLEKFDYRCLAFDPWSALQMQQELEKRTRKDTVISVPQTTQYLSPSMKEVEAAVIAGRLHHDGNPVLTWAISNVMVKPDGNDNIFPRKEDNGINKIDPAQALFTGMNRAMIGTGSRRSVYETRGILSL